jgi:hypothetical protein
MRRIFERRLQVVIDRNCQHGIRHLAFLHCAATGGSASPGQLTG